MTRALAWLTPRATGPVLSLPSGSAEAEALRLDGLVTEVWPGSLRARDLGHGAPGRAAAVAQLVPGGGVLGYRTAVWVHTGHDRPERLDVVLTGGRHRSNPGVRMHAERLPLADVVRVGGRAVTSPGRTAVDVARRCPPEAVRRWLDALGEQGLCPAEVAAALGRAAGLRGAPRARSLLAPVLQAAVPLF